MVERLAVTGSTAGADTSSLQQIAELLDADWLPAAALTDARAGGTKRPGRRRVGAQRPVASPYPVDDAARSSFRSGPVLPETVDRRSVQEAGDPDDGQAAERVQPAPDRPPGARPPARARPPR